jgi:hypothetical protein
VYISVINNTNFKKICILSIYTLRDGLSLKPSHATVPLRTPNTSARHHRRNNYEYLSFLSTSLSFLGSTRSLLYKISVELYTDKQENQFFLIFKEIQSGAVAKSYMRKGFLIYEEMRKYSLCMRRPLVIYDFATATL